MSRKLLFSVPALSFVALLGVDNLVVVRSGDALLVTTREHADQVRALVERMTNDRSPHV